MSKQTHAHIRKRAREKDGDSKSECDSNTHNCFGSLIKGRELVVKVGKEHSMRLLWLFTLMEIAHTHTDRQATESEH